ARVRYQPQGGNSRDYGHSSYPRYTPNAKLTCSGPTHELCYRCSRRQTLDISSILRRYDARLLGDRPRCISTATPKLSFTMDGVSGCWRLSLDTGSSNSAASVSACANLYMVYWYYYLIGLCAHSPLTKQFPCRTAGRVFIPRASTGRTHYDPISMVQCVVVGP